MNINFWLGITGTITGVISLVLYFVEIFRYKPVLSIKILEYKTKTLTQNSYGELVPLPNDKSIDDYKDNLRIFVKFKILFNNKGNKKTTINKIEYICKHEKFELKIEKRSETMHWRYDVDLLIPLDVGESYIYDYSLSISKDTLKILNVYPARIIVTDNRDKKHLIKLRTLSI